MHQVQRVNRSQLGLHQIRRVLPLAIGLLTLTMTNPALAQERALRILTVTGQGTESIPATLAQVTLGVEVQAETAEAAQQQAAQRSNAVIELLRSTENVTRLQTTGLYLNPTYDYNSSSPQITGYTATNTVSFRVPTTQTGPLLDRAIQAGATRIDGVTFVAEDEAIATAQQQAIQEATQAAQVQADAALSALGFTRDEIVGIHINGASYAPPVPYYRSGNLQAAEAAAPTPVVGGEQEVQATVTLEISY
ncbi:MAG: SIMPL domain-containing protein [Elainellaceae cyanobacterium]